MNYYVVSPNIYNDGDNYADEMYSKGIAAVGWKLDTKNGQIFNKIQAGDCIIVAQRTNWNWKYFYMGLVVEEEDKTSCGTLSKKLSPIIKLSNNCDLGFDKWSVNGSKQIQSPQRIDEYNDNNKVIIKQINFFFNMERYKTLIISNHNLILTGAPGTGKTHLAKQIAAQLILGKEYDKKTASREEKQKMDEQFDFVQFHPSFDYTDFVEGLRPTDDGNISFHRKDGIFMDFCRKALNALKGVNNAKDAPKYVFVIDEINRGDLSKIFGELFFSIDPGYRGEKGKVKTQYNNLWKDKDKFDSSEFFYVPENVYIIGTMNDIDRSVESMDFAMRRRFAWKEISSESTQSMLDNDKAWEDIQKPSEIDIKQIKERMNNLNLAILTISGLSTAYQIGAAYFLKLKNYLSPDGKLEQSSWENLWNNHLKGLLFEYLRGLPEAEENLIMLEKAYNLDQDNIFEMKEGKVIKKQKDA